MGWLEKIAKLEDKRLRVFAYGALTMAVTDSAVGILAMSLGELVLGFPLLAIGVGITPMIPMLFTRHHTVPRVLVPYLSIICLVLPLAYYGSNVNLYYTCFIGAVYPFVCFSMRERKQIFLTLPAPMIFALSADLIDFAPVFTYLGLEARTYSGPAYLDRIIMVGSYLLATACYYFFALETEIAQTKQEKAVAELRVANERDRILNKELNNLVKIICHDIANPLLTANLAVDQIPSDDKYVPRVQKAIRDMGTIVESVRTLQLARNEGRSFDGEPVMLENVFRECKSALVERLEGKQLTLELELDEWTEKNPVLADQRLLAHQVLINLVTNAIKFSNSGETITVKAFRDAERDRVILKVIDRGIGIPGEIIGTLFEPGRRNSRRGTSDEKGTGFGLAIAKSCLVYMGGDIKVSSKTEDAYPEDHGTEFEITLRAS